MICLISSPKSLLFCYVTATEYHLRSMERKTLMYFLMRWECMNGIKRWRRRARGLNSKKAPIYLINDSGMKGAFVELYITRWKDSSSLGGRAMIAETLQLTLLDRFYLYKGSIKLMRNPSRLSSFREKVLFQLLLEPLPLSAPATR